VTSPSPTRPGIAFEPVGPVLPAVPHAYWTLERVARALATGPSHLAPLGGVSTDTRTLRRGDLFVALRGDNFDAHDFLHDAASAGAAALVVSDAVRAVGLGLPVYVVPDTLVALGTLATAWRHAWGRSVIAVAGSNGKTSTKELLRAALGGSFDVHATAGNLNNLIGVPLTLLAIPPEAEIAVVELGTNAPGEVARLRDICAPDMAVLTSIGEEHLEGLGDMRGVLEEECAVFDGAQLAIAPSAYPDAVQLACARASTTITAGLHDADVVPDSWQLDEEGRSIIAIEGETIRLPLRGAHQAANAMLALAVARACGAPIADAARGLRSMPVPGMRGVWQPLGDAILINDAYNANPPSMRAALELLSSVGDGRQRVAILGSMRELGVHSAVQHEEIARAAMASRADLIVGVGEFAEAFDAAAAGDPRVLAVPEFDDLWEQLEPRLSRSAIILLKASRGMRLERLVPSLSTWATA
jgi:UDP-N-acetylmuramoyl-tripeptide--D-alanyl-D-alanine ligase